MAIEGVHISDLSNANLAEETTNLYLPIGSEAMNKISIKDFEKLLQKYLNYISIDTGEVSITCTGIADSNGKYPSASAKATFNKTFKNAPVVIPIVKTTVPGTSVLGCSVYNVTTTGCDVYLTRTNSQKTTVNWIAIGSI